MSSSLMQVAHRVVARTAPLFLAACSASGSQAETEQAPKPPSAVVDAELDASPEPDADVWDSLDEPGPLNFLCAPDSDDLADARRRYDELDTLVQGLTFESSITGYREAALALYRHPCLRVARIDEPGLEFDVANGVQAKHDWDAGLDMWFRSYLDLAAGEDPTVWLKPSSLDVVTAQTRPDDPLAPWLCPADGENDCAAAVESWRFRAERYYELYASSGRRRMPDCAAAIEDGPVEDAYARWRDCEEAGLRRHDALPVGGLGTVETGWVIAYGRRGHYQYCDELAAFDLKTGAHFRFADCEHRPELDGMQSAGAIAPPPEGIVVEVGSIDLELLREAAWAAMSVRYVQRDVVTDRALGRQLPPGLKVQRRHAGFTGGLGLSGTGSSGHTTLAWLWVREAGPVTVFGELSWPTGLSDAAEDHAVRLLSIAEARSKPGCAPAELPDWIVETVATDKLPKSEYELVDPPSRAIVDAVRKQQKKGRCG